MKAIVWLLTAIILSNYFLGCMQDGETNQAELLRIIQNKSRIVDDVLKEPDKYKVRILYTLIDRDADNIPAFRSLSFRMNLDDYFYPASTVKFPAAILALEKLNRLDIAGLNKYSPLRIDSAYSGQTVVTEDSTAPGNQPTIAHYIRKIFLVSDNDAYNRLYEFLGQQYINQRLWKIGLPGIKLIRRLETGLSPVENRATNPYVFFENGKVVYTQPLVVNPNEYRIEMKNVKQGRGYIQKGELVNQPIDFSHSNFFPLDAQQTLMKMIMFPESVPLENRFELTGDDYQFLYTYMSMLPRESSIPAYEDTTEYFDGYLKFFIYGDSREKIPGNLRIFNKSGQAYGYLIDNAYVIDFENRIEFLLTAMLQVNENQIYNDDNYEYDSIGLPFLADLGRIIYEYELNREREFAPDLSRFKVIVTGEEK